MRQSTSFNYFSWEYCNIWKVNKVNYHPVRLNGILNWVSLNTSDTSIYILSDNGNILQVGHPSKKKNLHYIPFFLVLELYHIPYRRTMWLGNSDMSLIIWRVRSDVRKKSLTTAVTPPPLPDTFYLWPWAGEYDRGIKWSF